MQWSRKTLPSMQTARRSSSPNGRPRNACRRFVDNATNRRDTALLDVARSVTSASTGSNVPAYRRVDTPAATAASVCSSSGSVAAAHWKPARGTSPSALRTRSRGNSICRPARSPAVVYLRNSWPSWSGAMPRPSSATETATCSPSRAAAIRMGAESGEWRAALASRLLSTCTRRCRSAMTLGRSGGRSMRTVCRPPPLMNAPGGLVHQRGDLGGLGRDRQRAGVDAPGVEQVADQAVDAVGRLVDDAEELRHLGRGDEARGAERRGGRALDRGQWRAQLVAHHAQELGPHALDLPQRRQVLQGDHHRGERVVRAVRVVDRGGVDERRDAAPVRDREHDLLGPHRLGAVQRPRQRQPVECDLAPVGAPAGDDPEQLLGGLAGAAQALDDACGLAVERDQAAGPRIEHDDADR